MKAVKARHSLLSASLLAGPNVDTAGDSLTRCCCAALRYLPPSPHPTFSRHGHRRWLWWIRKALNIDVFGVWVAELVHCSHGMEQVGYMAKSSLWTWRQTVLHQQVPSRQPYPW
ncbi:unnamed protein product [Ectocarpus fasciculatus]